MNDYYLITVKEDEYNSTLRDSIKQYNLDDACRACGTGWSRNGLDVNKLPKSDFSQTMLEDLIISERLYKHLEDREINLGGLSRISYKGEKQNFYCLRGSFELQPMNLEKSKGIIIENQCPKCKRNGFFDTLKEDLEYHYPLAHFEKVEHCDILNTWEYFGVSVLNPTGNRVFKMARQRVVVTSRVYEAINAFEYNKNFNFNKIFTH